jgi:hypothetical protein
MTQFLPYAFAFFMLGMFSAIFSLGFLAGRRSGIQQARAERDECELNDLRAAAMGENGTHAG